MKLFLSWPGDRSKMVAESLRDWLPDFIQAVEPWLSVADIDKGARWEQDILEELDSSRVSILCLTRDNLNEPWILFEAGALSKTKDSHTCTFLLDLAPGDLVYPLLQFQATTCEKDDVRKLVHSINKRLAEAGGKPLDDARLDKLFEKHWGELEAKLDEARNTDAQAPRPARDERELLEEILSTVPSRTRRGHGAKSGAVRTKALAALGIQNY